MGNPIAFKSTGGKPPKYGFLIALVNSPAIAVISVPIITSINVDETKLTIAQPTTSPMIDDGIKSGSNVSASAGLI